MTLQAFDYHGYPALRLHGTHLTLDFLAQAGPRLVGLRIAGGDENILAETPDVTWDTPHGVYHVYGGHRLWQSPEAPVRTYVPDDGGLSVREIPNGVILTGAREIPTGMRKRLTVTLDPARPALTLTHRITNEGEGACELAAWAITQLPHGGRIFLPQTVGTLPPDDPDAVFWPNRHLVLWNYTRLSDPRLKLGDDCILIETRPLLPPLKIGYLNTHGWAACQRGGVLFVKSFNPQADLPHTDRNANTTVYCNDKFAELETLGPLTELAPAEYVEHTEHWQVFTGIEPDSDYEKITQLMEEP